MKGYGYRLIVGLMSLIIIILLWIPLNQVFGQAADALNSATAVPEVIQRNNMVVMGFYYTLLIIAIVLVVWIIKTDTGGGDELGDASGVPPSFCVLACALAFLAISGNAQAYGSYYQNALNTSETAHNITFPTASSQYIGVNVPRNLNATSVSWLATGYTSDATTNAGYATQPGYTVLPIGVTTMYVPLDSPVADTSHAFVMLPHYYSCVPEYLATNGALNSNNCMVVADLYNTTHVRIRRQSSSESVTVDWILVEALNSEFTRYSSDYSWSNTSGTVINIPTGQTVDPASAMVLVWSTIDQNDAGLYAVSQFRGYAINSTYVRILRDTSTSVPSASGNLTWALVEFKPGSIDSIQTGTTTVSNHPLGAPRSIALGASVNMSTSMMFFQIGSSVSTVDNMSVAGRLVDDGHVEFYSQDSAETKNILWYVVDFGSGAGNRYNGSEVILYGSGNAIFDRDLTPAVALNRTIIWTSSTSNRTSAMFPTSFWAAFMTNSTNIRHAQSRYFYSWNEWQVLELPQYYIPSYPENITVDIGADGTDEYVNDTVFNTSETMRMTPSALNDILRNNCTADWATGSCSVIMKVTSSSGGILDLRSINITGEYVYGRYDVCMKIEDDWDEPFDMTSANVSLNVFCDDGSQLNYYNLTNNCSEDLMVYCEMAAVGARVDYAGDAYVREIIAPAPAWDGMVTLYLVDALVDTVLQMPIYMDDVNYRDASLELYKTEGAARYTIASGYFDVEHKLLTYLKKDSRYYLRIEDSGVVREISYLYAYTATSQHLSLSTISLAPTVTLINDNLLMTREFDNASAPTTTLRISYQDLMNQTISVRIRVFSDVNNTPFFDNTYTGDSNFTVSILNVNTNFRYSIHFTVSHAVLGNSPVDFTTAIGRLGEGFNLGLPPELEWLYIGFAFFVVLMTTLTITPDSRLPGMIILLVETGAFAAGQWMLFESYGVIALLVVFLVAGILLEIKHEKVSS